MKLFTPRFDGTLLAWAQRFVRMLFLALVTLVVSWSCGGSSSSSMAPSTAPSSATVSSVAVNGPTDFASIGQTVQITATATFSHSATENMSATATWQALSVGATVTSGGLVTAVTSGAVTIMPTYEGKSGLAVVQISYPPSRSSMSATIDGASWDAISVWVAKIDANSAFPSGRLNILGTNSFTGQYVEVVVTVPAIVGTYSSDALDVRFLAPALGAGAEGAQAAQSPSRH